jgi:hypothetical protein
VVGVTTAPTLGTVLGHLLSCSRVPEATKVAESTGVAQVCRARAWLGLCGLSSTWGKGRTEEVTTAAPWTVAAPSPQGQGLSDSRLSWQLVLI